MSDAERGLVELLVAFAEHVEHDGHVGIVIGEPGAHGAHGDFASFFLGKAEHARADAAERDRAQLVGGGKVEAAALARSQLLAVLVGGITVGDGPDSVQHVL